MNWAISLEFYTPSRALWTTLFSLHCNANALSQLSPIHNLGVFHFIVVKPVKYPGDKSTEILAAVSAGMVPATVAMLMPIVLGRKRRSIAIQLPASIMNESIQTTKTILDDENRNQQQRQSQRDGSHRNESHLTF